MTSAIRLNHLTKEILISKSFAKAAMNPTSIEYLDLAEVMSKHTDYKVSQRHIKTNSNKECYHGLTYDYMRWYITVHVPVNKSLKYLDELEKKIDISRCHSIRYPVIKNWFLNTFPEVKDFGKYEIESHNIIELPNNQTNDSIPA